MSNTANYSPDNKKEHNFYLYVCRDDSKPQVDQQAPKKNPDGTRLVSNENPELQGARDCQLVT